MCIYTHVNALPFRYWYKLCVTYGLTNRQTSLHCLYIHWMKNLKCEQKKKFYYRLFLINILFYFSFLCLVRKWGRKIFRRKNSRLAVYLKLIILYSYLFVHRDKRMWNLRWKIGGYWQPYAYCTFLYEHKSIMPLK